MFRRITAVTAVVALGAVPLSLATAAPAHADAERHGTCGTGLYELSVDREGGGFDVSVDLDRLAAGQEWRVVIRHDGSKVASVVRRADNEGDLELERYRKNSAGKDAFKFTATRVGGASSCSDTITLS